MRARVLEAVLREVRAGLGEERAHADGELLDAFRRQRCEAAFAELLRRHGPTVRAVCRRVLGPTPDADDAFQATFLILVHKSRSIRRGELLANWLCAVAWRAARQLRRQRDRRFARERQVEFLPEPAASAAPPRDWLPLFDSALHALPAKYRDAVVLCELQGLGRTEAAQRLGLSEGTLSSRLARARRLLARRLGRHGFPLAAGTVLVPAVVPEALAESTRRRAVALAVHLVALPDLIPAPLLELTGVVMRETLLKRVRTAVVLTVAVVALSPFAARLAKPGFAEAPRGVELPMPAAPSPKKDPAEPIAIINGDVKLTRQEYGEFLIRMYGSEKLKEFVNLSILERACAAKNLRVSDAEVAAEIQRDLNDLRMDEAAFTSHMLKQWHHTLLSWREQVVRPRLLARKLFGTDVSVGDAEIRREFENRTGPKVRCRILVWPAAEAESARWTADVVRRDPAQFDRLFSTPPAGHGTEVTLARRVPESNDQKAADAAFALKAGEVSALLEGKDSLMLIECLEHTPAVRGRDFEAEAHVIRAELLRRKVEQEIARRWPTLLADAKPQLLLK